MKRLLLILFILFSLCSQAWAEGDIIDRGATDAEAVALSRNDVWLSPSNLPALHNSALAYVSTGGTQTIDSNATFEKLDEGAIAYTAGLLENFTHSDGRLTYTGVATVHAFVLVSIGVESGEAAQIVRFRIAENGTSIANTNMTREFTGANRDSCVSLNWTVELATNDYIEIFGVSDTDGDTFDINNMTITIINEN